MIFHLLQVITALWNSSFFAYFSDFWFIIDEKCYEFVRNGIVHRTLTFLCIYHQKKASKLRISMLSLNAFFLIILLLLLFMSVLDNIYFPRFFRPMHLSRKAHDSESLLKYKGQNSIFYPLYFYIIISYPY